MNYTLEYQMTRCLRCGKLLTEHRRFTAEDINATRGATFEHPINGYRAPISMTLVGEWMLHEPMPWKINNLWKVN